jgi:predicted ferric reductase
MIRASGVTAWGLLTAVVLWGLLLRTRLLGSKAGPVSLLAMHRWLGALALGALAVHLVLLLVDPMVRFTVPQLLVPGLAPWQPVAVAFGVLAMWALLPVTIIGRLRTKLGSAGAGLFRKSHVVSYFAWPLATAHYILAGTDALTEWSIALMIAGSSLLVFGLLARGFVPKPAPQRRAMSGAPTP